MFLMVRNDLFHTEQQNGNIKNIQEEPELTVTKTEEQQTGQKDFFNVRKILMTQARKESESNYNRFAEKEMNKIEDELLTYFLEKIM